jgi:hypothetical protein
MVFQVGCPQRSLVRLADGVFGDGVHHGDRGRTFVAGEFAGANVVQCFEIDGVPWSRLDVGGDGLTPFVIGNADNGGLQHGWIAGQYLFDLLGVDVFSAADDHVFGSPHQCQVAVGVEMTDVTGVHPAVDDDAGGFVGTPKIAAHDVGAGDEHLAIDPRG